MADILHPEISFSSHQCHLFPLLPLLMVVLLLLLLLLQLCLPLLLPCFVFEPHCMGGIQAAYLGQVNTSQEQAQVHGVHDY